MPINGGKTTAWVGSVDTAWATAGNWTNGVPASNNTTGLADTVIIRKDAVRGILSGTNRTTDDAGKGLRIYEFLEEPGVIVDIGTSAAPLQFNWQTAVFQGSGSAYVSGSSGSVAQNCVRTICKRQSSNLALWFKSPVSGTASTHVGIEIVDGLAHVQQIATEDFVVNPFVDINAAPIVVLNGTSTITITNYFQVGGRTLNKGSAITEISQRNGLFEVNGPINTGTPTEIEVSGGTFKYLTIPTSGSSPLFKVTGGLLDLESITGITLASVILHPSAHLNRGIGNTITTETHVGVYPYP